MSGRRWWILAAVTLGGTAWACDVPVYRWALERWEADPFEAVVFHHGTLDAAGETCVATLEGGRAEGANLLVKTVNLDAPMPPAMAALWKRQQDPVTPWLVVRFPLTVKGQPPAWSGPLTTETCEGVIHSPVRRRVAADLIDGEAGVFIFLASGDKRRDERAEATLVAALKKAEEHLELPTGSTAAAPQMDDALLDKLDVRFSMIRVARNDPREQILVSTLLGIEPDLRGLDGPMAFPVFGRGRALYALVDRGINEDTIAEACSFIVGSCTCQVKDLNPGTDLLLAANWEDKLDTLLSVETLVRVLPRPSEMIAATAAPGNTVPEGADLSSPSPAATPPSLPAPADEAPRSLRGKVILNVGLAILGGLIVVVAASILLVYRKRHQHGAM